MPSTGPTVRTVNTPSFPAGLTGLQVVDTETLGSMSRGSGATASYLAAATGVQATLIAAGPVDRIVQIIVTIDTAFANGDGAQPTFKIGQTGSDAKFAATSKFTGAAAASTFAVAGILSANKDLFVTATAGTGTTETGALTVTAIAFPQ